MRYMPDSTIVDADGRRLVTELRKESGWSGPIRECPEGTECFFGAAREAGDHLVGIDTDSFQLGDELSNDFRVRHPAPTRAGNDVLRTATVRRRSRGNPSASKLLPCAPSHNRRGEQTPCKRARYERARALMIGSPSVRATAMSALLVVALGMDAGDRRQAAEQKRVVPSAGASRRRRRGIAVVPIESPIRDSRFRFPIPYWTRRVQIMISPQLASRRMLAYSAGMVAAPG